MNVVHPSAHTVYRIWQTARRSFRGAGLLPGLISDAGEKRTPCQIKTSEETEGTIRHIFPFLGHDQDSGRKKCLLWEDGAPKCCSCLFSGAVFPAIRPLTKQDGPCYYVITSRRVYFFMPGFFGRPLSALLRAQLFGWFPSGREAIKSFRNQEVPKT